MANPVPDQTLLDESHDSAARGEHRYPDRNQTAAERTARNDRDDLKRRLAGRLDTPRPRTRASSS